MENPLPGPPVQEPLRRPTLLTTLCILTFIGSGMNLFSSLTIAGFFDIFMEIAADLTEKYNLPGMEFMAMTTPGYFLTTALFYAGSVAGAIMMMKLKKTGFHLYTISQILLLITPMYFLKLPGPGIAELFFAGLFVFLYSLNLKVMHR